MQFDKERWEVDEVADNWTERSLFNVVGADSKETVIGTEGLFDSEDVDRERAKLFSISRELLLVARAVCVRDLPDDVTAFAKETLSRFDINFDLLT